MTTRLYSKPTHRTTRARRPRPNASLHGTRRDRRGFGDGRRQRALATAGAGALVNGQPLGRLPPSEVRRWTRR